MITDERVKYLNKSGQRDRRTHKNRHKYNIKRTFGTTKSETIQIMLTRLFTKAYFRIDESFN